MPSVKRSLFFPAAFAPLKIPMSLDHEASSLKGPTKPQVQAQLISTTTAATSRPARRRIFLRRRKLATVRLGGNGPNKRGPFLVKMLRKMRLRWLKLHYLRMLKRLKEYYRGLIKDIIEAGATFEAYQQRLVMEASCTVPMGVSSNNFPSMAGSDRPRSIFLIMKIWRSKYTYEGEEMELSSSLTIEYGWKF